jgi:transcriptional regulator with XRE-family HTH domain
MTSRGFGRVLRALRKGKGLGLRELAKDADVPPGYLAELETGKKRNPSLDVLKLLAKALDVPLPELLE